MALSSSTCAEVVMKPYILSAAFARNITMRSMVGNLNIHTAWVLRSLRRHEELEQSHLHIVERWIANGELDEVRLLHGRSVMRECVKACFPMIRTDARVLQSAKGKMGAACPDDHIIDGHAAARHVVHDGLAGSRASAEDIAAERMSVRTRDVDGILEVVIGEDGQHGSEYFLLHHRFGQRDVAYDGGLDLKRFWISATSADDASVRAAAIDQCAHHVIVLLIDHVGIVRALQRLRPIVVVD